MENKDKTKVKNNRTRRTDKETAKRVVFISISCLCIAIILLGWFYYRKPLIDLKEQTAILRENQEELKSKKLLQLEMANQIGFLKSEAGIKYIAKSHGFFDKDDILITIVSKKVVEKEQPKKKNFFSWFSRDKKDEK